MTESTKFASRQDTSIKTELMQGYIPVNKGCKLVVFKEIMHSY